MLESSLSSIVRFRIALHTKFFCSAPFRAQQVEAAPSCHGLSNQAGWRGRDGLLQWATQRTWWAPGMPNSLMRLSSLLVESQGHYLHFLIITSHLCPLPVPGLSFACWGLEVSNTAMLDSHSVKCPPTSSYLQDYSTTGGTSVFIKYLLLATLSLPLFSLLVNAF